MKANPGGDLKVFISNRDSQCDECGGGCPGMRIVSQVLCERLVLCGDAAVATLRRVSRGGPQPLQKIASGVLMTL